MSALYWQAGREITSAGRGPAHSPVASLNPPGHSGAQTLESGPGRSSSVAWARIAWSRVLLQALLRPRPSSSEDCSTTVCSSTSVRLAKEFGSGRGLRRERIPEKTRARRSRRHRDSPRDEGRCPQGVSMHLGVAGDQAVAVAPQTNRQGSPEAGRCSPPISVCLVDPVVLPGHPARSSCPVIVPDYPAPASRRDQPAPGGLTGSAQRLRTGIPINGWWSRVLV